MIKEPPRYILITGAAGTGTTTLARALAIEWQLAHLEADDYLWLPSDPPYQHLADKDLRDEHLLVQMRCAGRAVVAGSIMGWGQALEDIFDLVVFLALPVDLRLERLERREIERFGSAKPEFLEWAAQYEDGSAAAYRRRPGRDHNPQARGWLGSPMTSSMRRNRCATDMSPSSRSTGQLRLDSHS